jgi:hypothetical protein
MDGDARRRHCDACDREVVDLSAMSEKEARAVVERAREVATCVRYRARSDGMVVFAPDGAAAAPSAFPLRPIVLGLGLMLGAAALAPPAVTMGELGPVPVTVAPAPEPVQPPPVVMGELAVPPPAVKPARKPKPAPKPEPPREHILMGKLARSSD